MLTYIQVNDESPTELNGATVSSQDIKIDLYVCAHLLSIVIEIESLVSYNASRLC